jgi:hypothetical protein
MNETSYIDQADNFDLSKLENLSDEQLDLLEIIANITQGLILDNKPVHFFEILAGRIEHEVLEIKKQRIFGPW